jgi:hypothetical protein
MMATRRLPERTVGGKPTEPVAFLGQPGDKNESRMLALWRIGDGYLRVDHQGVNRFRDTDGRWQCGWNVENGLEICSAPVRDDTSLIICDGRSLIALFAQTLAEKWRIGLSELARVVGLSPVAVAKLMGPDTTGGGWILLHDDRSAQLVRFAQETPHALASGAIPTINWEPSLSVKALAGLREGVLVSVEGGVIALPLTTKSDKQPRHMKLDHSVDRLWPSPDGVHIVASGQGETRISALRMQQADEGMLDVSAVLEGMFVPATGGRAGGWLFWDKADPKVPGAAPLYDVGVAWSPDGSVVICGTRDGEAAIMEPEAGVGIKLMCPPGAPIYPIVFDPPDGLYCGSGAGAFRLAMDWMFSAQHSALDADETKQEVEVKSAPLTALVPQSGTTDERIIHKHPPMWLIPAAILALVAAYGLIRWLEL